MPPLQIIGCGNLDRGDDAAGLLVVHRLKDMGIPAKEAGGDVLALMPEWSMDTPLVLVDAAQTNAPTGEILRLLPQQLPRHQQELRYSTHGLGLAELVGLASALGRLPERVLVIAIAGARFGIGNAVSRPVLSAVEQVADEIASAWNSSDVSSCGGLIPPNVPDASVQDGSN